MGNSEFAHGPDRSQTSEISTIYYDRRIRAPAARHERVVTLASDDVAALPDEWTYQRLGGSTPPSIFDRYLLVQSLAALGRFAEATEYETEMLRLAERIHDAHPIGLAYQAASLLYTTKGDWARARPLIEHWIEAVRAGNLVVLYRAVALSAHVLAQLGEVRGAVGRLTEGMGLVDRVPAQERLAMAGAYRSLGHACVMLGRLDDARRFGNRALAFSPKTSAAAAQALHLLGDIASHSDRFDAESGEAHYRQALALAEPRGMRPLVAHCHLGLGKLYRRTGKREQAREHLTTATTMYREMDMRFWLERAETEMNVLR
jgi:tetratricopeptide (TPR) repeat protein